jgi:hypothetical protein
MSTGTLPLVPSDPSTPAPAQAQGADASAAPAAPAAAAAAAPDAFARLEPRLGSAAVVVGAVMFLAVPLPALAPSLGDLFDWAGAQLLAQGLARDLWLLLVARRAPACEDACVVGKAGGWLRGRRRGGKPVLCLESAAGAGPIGIGLLLMAAGATAVVPLPTAGAVMLGGAWWLCGWWTRDVVMEFRRAPDHRNVVVGFGRSQP